MNQEEPTKTFMVIQIERNPLVSMIYIKLIQRYKG